MVIPILLRDAILILYIDEREDVQKKTFAKWINSQLVKSSQPPVTDLFVDLQDGNRLLSLLEVLTGKQYVSDHNNDVAYIFSFQLMEQSDFKIKF
ncbi:Utrophin [Blattella germanica]|nr:Utrophin [Blattella germanica]